MENSSVFAAASVEKLLASQIKMGHRKSQFIIVWEYCHRQEIESKIFEPAAGTRTAPETSQNCGGSRPSTGLLLSKSGRRKKAILSLIQKIHGEGNRNEAKRFRSGDERKVR